MADREIQTNEYKHEIEDIKWMEMEGNRMKWKETRQNERRS